MALQLAVLAIGAFGVMARPAWMQDPNADPKTRAKLLLAEMKIDEKITMLHGTGNGGVYIGNVAGNDRLQIPALKLNDGPQGFRDNAHVGTTTCWPCAMAIAATWSEEAGSQWGTAMGKEFYQKGANVQLGPGMCLARVPRNGRNFEYLSGEDPYLGYRMVQPVIKGIQSQNVIANAKHWINNNQETNRHSVIEVLDERTEHELYMPPFEGAVAAEVGSIMCSYNKIKQDDSDSAWSCENNVTLNGDLKRDLKFQGWVMSDWAATHSTSLMQGLDQEMPGGTGFMSDKLTALVKASKIPQSAVDEAVLRILTPMFKYNIFDKPSPYNLTNNVTSLAHNQLARSIAAEGAVLLKNAKSLLPLSKHGGLHIAVIGPQAKKPVVHGGGSGAVVPYYVSAPYDAIREALGITGPSSEECDPTGKFCVSYSGGADAAQVAAAADVAVVFGHTYSGEGADRRGLNLDDGADDLIAAVAAAQPKTVAVAVVPGAILTPWLAATGAAVLMFMPGQEYGHAISDVLFGAVNPSGKLPLTLPNIDNEQKFSESQWPGINKTATYSEKMDVGYRWYDAHQVKPKLPFGHGLSYTSFSYYDLTASRSKVSFSLTNSGDTLVGKEVVQLYIKAPGAVGMQKQLKQFLKVSLEPHQSEVLEFDLNDRAFSMWDVETHAWKLVAGVHSVMVGASSGDIRLNSTITI